MNSSSSDNLIVMPRWLRGRHMGLVMLVASVAVVGRPSPARAGGVPTLETGNQTLEEIIVTAQRKGLVGRADSATEGTILPEQLRLRPIYRVGELLETVPGLIVTQHSGEGKANQYFLRGFNLDHGTDLEITLDDMPVNMRTHAHGQGYADLNFFIPELASGIQYRKGTYSAEEGEFATAGAVHIGLVDTLPRDIASISAGTLGDQRIFAAGSRPVGNGNLLADLSLLIWMDRGRSQIISVRVTPSYVIARACQTMGSR